MSGSQPDPFLGRTFDGYRVESVIGRGGMGVVYLATQLSLDRAVALKVLPEHVGDNPQFLERFHREVDILSRLSHPNIVTVFERGEVDGRPYLAMEYVKGTSLREVVKEGPLPPAEALSTVRSVLGALEHAHGQGIVHRDIKPENVLVAPGGIVKVADFGLSRLIGPEDTTRLTHTHLMLGTFEYMAPEQREKAKEADERSDLYATGVVLYEMIAGELPIGHFDPLSRKRPAECDSRVDKIIERSLDKEPRRRYQRASEMGEDVSRLLSRVGVEPESKVKAAVQGFWHDYWRDRREKRHHQMRRLKHLAEKMSGGEKDWIYWSFGAPWMIPTYLGGILMLLVMAFNGVDLHPRQWIFASAGCAAIFMACVVLHKPETRLKRWLAVGAISGATLAGVPAVGSLLGSVYQFEVIRLGSGHRWHNDTAELEGILHDPKVQIWMKRHVFAPDTYPEGVEITVRGDTVVLWIDATRWESTARDMAAALGRVLADRGGPGTHRIFTTAAHTEMKLEKLELPR